jgi:hypothetical protein
MTKGKLKHGFRRFFSHQEFLEEIRKRMKTRILSEKE